MNGRKAAVGLVVLCALGVTAFAAPAASANTASECEFVKSGASFSDEHCLTASSGAGFKHAPIAAHSPMNVSVTNNKTAGATAAAATIKLKGVTSGVPTEIQCTTAGGSGVMENTEESSVMFTDGIGTVEFSGCTVTVPIKGCVVAGNAFKTKQLFALTKGLTKQVKLEPAVGTELASITVESCSVAPLNHTFPVTGSLILDTSGATASSTHAGITTQSTLKMGGQNAGLEGAFTLSAEASGAGIVTT
jgi:hypothetical protein